MRSFKKLLQLAKTSRKNLKVQYFQLNFQLAMNLRISNILQKLQSTNVVSISCQHWNQLRTITGGFLRTTNTNTHAQANQAITFGNCLLCKKDDVKKLATQPERDIQSDS